MDGTAVGVIEGGEVFFIRTDHIGRPAFATNDLGIKVWEASYLPFGGVNASTGPNLHLRFPGQWFQAESGLHQNWMREYDPTTGRYIQADPLGLVDGASVYGYVGQNPGRYVDPRGEFILPLVFGFGLGFLVDTLIEKLESNCGCNSGILPDNKYSALGGAYAGTGAFAQKNRTGIGGGGPSGKRTSFVSKASPRDARKGGWPSGRDWGRRWKNRIPYAAAAFFAYDAWRLRSRFY